MKKKPNNKILLEHILNHADRDTLPITGKELQFATIEKLREYVNYLGDNPDTVIEDYRLCAPLHPVGASAPSAPSADEQAKRDAIDLLLKGSNAGLDEDAVNDIVRDVLNADVVPAMNDLEEKVDKLAPLTETLDKIAKAMNGSTNSRLPLATAVASGSNPILELIAPYYVAGSENPTKVCISAPPSYGKSYSVGLLGRSYDTFLTHGCSGDMDEWSMLLGNCTPKKEGGFITTDGTLAEAVRSAKDGKNTLFFMDEVFRMSPTTMEAMLAFLAPQRNAQGDLVYQLTTKQNDAGVLEKLECSTDKLHIVCATNLSSVQPPEAFMDRFLFKHVRYDASIVKAISESVADTYAIADADKLADRFTEAMGISRKMHGTGQLQKPLSIRDLERACTHATDATDEGVRQWLGANGMDALLMWNSDTGDIIEDSAKGVKQLAGLLA